MHFGDGGDISPINLFVYGLTEQFLLNILDSYLSDLILTGTPLNKKKVTTATKFTVFPIVCSMLSDSPDMNERQNCVLVAYIWLNCHLKKLKVIVTMKL